MMAMIVIRCFDASTLSYSNIITRIDHNKMTYDHLFWPYNFNSR